MGDGGLPTGRARLFYLGPFLEINGRDIFIRGSGSMNFTVTPLRFLLRAFQFTVASLRS